MSNITLIIKKNKDLSYSPKVRFEKVKCCRKHIYALYYRSPYDVVPCVHGEGQTNIYFASMLQIFVDFKRQYNITEKCEVKLIRQ